MTRRAVMQARVQVLRAHETVAACSAGLLFAARGTWDVRPIGGPPPLRIARVRTADCGGDGESLAWDLMPHAADDALIAVRVLPAHS